MDNLTEKTMAFAGICQAVKLIQELARDGSTNNELVEKALNSIIVTNPERTEEVYGSSEQLKLGYEVLIYQFGDHQQKDAELMRYILGILMLEKKLFKQSQTLQDISYRIEQVHRQLQHFSITDAQILANFASIYSDLISPLGPKVMISGKQHHIQSDINQHKIRALLLATMRSAVLWRQLGGKRRHLIFKRKDMIETAKKLIKN